jgi:hypothetical protein
MFFRPETKRFWVCQLLQKCVWLNMTIPPARMGGRMKQPLTRKMDEDDSCVQFGQRFEFHLWMWCFPLEVLLLHVAYGCCDQALDVGFHVIILPLLGGPKSGGLFGMLSMAHFFPTNLSYPPTIPPWDGTKYVAFICFIPRWVFIIRVLQSFMYRRFSHLKLPFIDLVSQGDFYSGHGITRTVDHLEVEIWEWVEGPAAQKQPFFGSHGTKPASTLYWVTLGG